MNYDEFMRLYNAQHNYQPPNYGSTPNYAEKFLGAYNSVKDMQKEKDAARKNESDKQKLASQRAGESAAASSEKTSETMQKLNEAKQDKSVGQASGFAANEAAQQATFENKMNNYKQTGDAALDVVANSPGYTYDYKNPEKHGFGRHIGPMAQDLAKTPAGSSVVKETPDGLAVDTNRLSLVNTAAAHAMQNEIEGQQSEIERMRKELEALKAMRRA